jgi:hypothetical protein
MLTRKAKSYSNRNKDSVLYLLRQSPRLHSFPCAHFHQPFQCPTSDVEFFCSGGAYIIRKLFDKITVSLTSR